MNYRNKNIKLKVDFTVFSRTDGINYTRLRASVYGVLTWAVYLCAYVHRRASCLNGVAYFWHKKWLSVQIYVYLFEEVNLKKYLQIFAVFYKTLLYMKTQNFIKLMTFYEVNFKFFYGVRSFYEIRFFIKKTNPHKNAAFS